MRPGKIFPQLVIQLPKVNDSQYPPQRKSFSMLAYYHDHQIENFDWFMRMDDDSVLQWDNLNEFLEPDNKIYSDNLIGHLLEIITSGRSINFKLNTVPKYSLSLIVKTRPQ